MSVGMGRRQTHERNDDRGPLFDPPTILFEKFDSEV